MNTRRRNFITAGLALVGFGGRRAWAQDATAPIRYAALTRRVSVPVQDVITPWKPVPFVAEAIAPPKAAAPPRRVLIHGVLFRHAGAGAPAAESPPTIKQLSALCVTCPHEQCQVDLVTDEAQLSRMTGGTAVRPLFECGCHQSVFDAADGAKVSGETPRGLYRFRIAGVSQASVEIGEVEEVALFEV
jgi:Rieske Fe-S protein